MPVICGICPGYGCLYYLLPAEIGGSMWVGNVLTYGNDAFSELINNRHFQ